MSLNGLLKVFLYGIFLHLCKFQLGFELSRSIVVGSTFSSDVLSLQKILLYTRIGLRSNLLCELPIRLPDCRIEGFRLLNFVKKNILFALLDVFSMSKGILCPLWWTNIWYKNIQKSSQIFLLVFLSASGQILSCISWELYPRGSPIAGS